MKGTNIFRHYSQAENRYTNGLISLLKISLKTDDNILTEFGRLAGINLSKNSTFKVLRDFEGTADAEILDDNSAILIETKIVSGTLRNEQIKRHLKVLTKYKQKNKRLVLLTPDSENSNYVQKFINLSPKSIVHLSWNSIIELLRNKSSGNVILNDLKSDYIDEIKEDIFEQDISAVIVKINFGDKSDVYPEEYLDEFRNGEWKDWHTPRKYNELDGKGKKLILYDKHRGLVLEVEIEKVRRDPKRGAGDSYSWSNKFARNTLKIYTKPIPLSIIKNVPDENNKFLNFNRCSTPHWNLTREQYEWLNGKS